jgi:hypothetical protein
MAKSLVAIPASPSIRVIVQDALRAAVHARSEREGFDVLADALRKVSELTAANQAT